jgi:phosphoribosylformylglycinamidine synthase
MYTVGEVTGDHRFTFASKTTGLKPMDLELKDMFGSSPKVVMEDKTIDRKYEAVTYDNTKIDTYLERVLQLEAVAFQRIG